MPELTQSEREFLAFALDLAFDQMVSGDGFTDDDWAAHDRLKQIAMGASDA